jgi:hypothetical protein
MDEEMGQGIVASLTLLEKIRSFLEGCIDSPDTSLRCEATRLFGEVSACLEESATIAKEEERLQKEMEQHRNRMQFVHDGENR